MPFVLSHLFGSDPDPAPIETLSDFRARHQAVLADQKLTADQALCAGFCADRVAYAFAGGYEAALACLTKGKIDPSRTERPTSLCITEEGGGHPRAVKTSITELPDGRLSITGKKQWATGAPLAELLLVAASTGVDAEGKNRLVLVAIGAHAPGVSLKKMPDPPFAPELSHALVELDGAIATRADVLPGDGYDTYIKPFRTIEDAHVFLALIGHVIRGGRLYGAERDLLERAAAIALTLREITVMDPSAPETHIALAGALDLGRALLEASSSFWSRAPPEVRARWERDRALSMVAERARGERRARAWQRIGGRA